MFVLVALAICNKVAISVFPVLLEYGQAWSLLYQALVFVIVEMIVTSP
jgi:hypothetical protein